MSTWRWQDHVGPLALAAIFGSVLAGSLLIAFAFGEMVEVGDGEARVAAFDGAADLNRTLVLEEGVHSFLWQTDAPPYAADYRWNVTVRLERVGGGVVTEGHATWEEHAPCVGGAGGVASCSDPPPYRLMRLHLEAGSYGLRVEAVEANASAGAGAAGATLEVRRAVPPPAAAVALLGGGVALAVAWAVPFAWWLRRKRCRYLLEDAAFGARAVPEVVEEGDR